MISKAYKAVLQEKHRVKPWSGTHGKYAEEVLMRACKGDRILDFGCAKQDLKKRVKEIVGNDVDVVGYDPGQPGLDIFPEGDFDIVVATDVLEHIEPETLEMTLLTLGIVCRKAMFFVVSTRATGNKLPDGRDHHLIVKPREWWEEKFRKFLYPSYDYEFRWENKNDFACWLTRKKRERTDKP
jgi:hypothetical protein